MRQDNRGGLITAGMSTHKAIYSNDGEYRIRLEREKHEITRKGWRADERGAVYAVWCGSLHVRDDADDGEIHGAEAGELDWAVFLRGEVV
jgi:hypothetical protein